ncbi:DUF805 domain-containing protein [Bifidobacterium crudilactis]|jgi:uncharacterized membrane protein YhaH (DUF805 family)|uniref:DUF805 domain-containing protein n=1 Tax=Bifidobacterium crudilactis TaxID=327277 RepID=UPI002F350E88
MNPDNTDPREQDQRLPEFGQYAPDQQQAPKAPSDEAPPQYGQRVPEYIPQYTSQSTPQYAQQASAPSTLPQIPPQYDASGNAFGQEPPLYSPWYGIGFGKAIQRFFAKYAIFSGRASRGEVWWMVLFSVIVTTVVLSPLRLISPSVNTWAGYAWELALFIPWLAVGVRRLHDANHSGWWIVLPTLLTHAASIGLDLFVTGRLQNLLEYVAANGTIEGYPGDTQSLIALALILVCMAAVGGILWIIFMCLNSNASGARFDKQTPQDSQRPGTTYDRPAVPNSEAVDSQHPNFRQAG